MLFKIKALMVICHSRARPLRSGGGGLGSEKDMDLKKDAVVEEDGGAEAPPPPHQEEPSENGEKARPWKLSVFFLCFYGFMTALKPGEAFITPNLLSPEKNFTREQVGERQQAEDAPPRRSPALGLINRTYSSHDPPPHCG